MMKADIQQVGAMRLRAFRRGVKYAFCGGVCIASLLFAFAGVGEDWPMFRHDNARSAITAEDLPASLALQWVFTPLHGPEPAWSNPAKEKARVRFDEAFHVAVVGDAVYFGSSADNKVYCLDAATGQVRWSTITGGPVRVAPCVVDGRVYVGSDDGCAYCLGAADGAILWKVRASWRDDRVLGNGKIISLWPLRTGVLVDKGVAYFAAGVFPHESIFVCAVKADDGTLLWRNDSAGEIGYKQEYGGISPQGPILASETTLFVPSGRAMPAAFSKDDGKLLYYISPGGKVGGTWALLTEDRVVAGIETKRAYDQERGTSRAHTEAYAWFPGTHLVVAEDYAYMLTFEELVALDRKAFEFAGQWRSRIELERKPLADLLNALKRKERTVSGEELETVRKNMGELGKQIQYLNEEQNRIEQAVHRWRRPCDEQDALLLAGGQLFAGGVNRVSAAHAKTGEELWCTEVDGKACGLAAANGRLFVSTDTGKIYGFGKESAAPQEVTSSADPAPYAESEYAALCVKAADRIVAGTGITKGFCLVYGCGTGRLAYELAQRTELNIVAVDPDPQNVQAARKALDAAGLYGTRVVVDQGDLAGLPYADYFANLVVSETMLTTGQPLGSADELVRVLKPHGGTLCLGYPAGVENAAGPDALCSWLNAHAQCPGAGAAEAIASEGVWAKLARGALPGEGKWTHQYADTANTACSDDELVKGSLATLWFGRPGPEAMVERHARAAAPLAMDGRLFVQGENLVMAYDSYNGLLLWQKEIPGAVRVRVDSDMSNLALTRDGLYVAAEDRCYRLDPATGETLHTYTMPGTEAGEPRRWGYLACVDGTMYGSVAPSLIEPYGSVWENIVDEDGTWHDFDETVEKHARQQMQRDAAARFKAQFAEPSDRAFWNAQQSGFMWHPMYQWPAWGSVSTPAGAVTERIVASKTFFALDAGTGEVRWKYDGEAVAHPAVAIADGLVFLADCRVTEEQKQAAMAERQALIDKGVWEKEDISYAPKDADVRLVLALDAATGEKRWDRVIDLTGCGGDRMGLAYKDGVLCFFGCFSNHDRNLFKEGKLKWRRITALSGKDGGDLWSRPLDYLRRPLIIGDTIIIEPRACDLHTGAVKTRVHPLTGAESTWEFVRPGHCCSITSASPNMFFLRGYHMWYYDLEKDQGMLPYGGIRPGCWINLVPANGLLLFPEASAGCTCSYPVRSTVAMQPREEQRTWSFCVQHGALTPVQHMAVNFGAPGDWRDEDGTLWFSYPHPPSTSWQTYGIGFDLDEQFVSKPAYFCRNFQGYDVKGTDKPWLYASGCEGLTRCVLPLLDEGQGPGTYTVRMYFVEKAAVAPGQRIFSVKLQDKTVLSKFDIVKEAGGRDAAVVKEFTGIRVDETGLRVELIPNVKEPGPDQAPLLNGIEVIREDLRVAQAG